MATLERSAAIVISLQILATVTGIVQSAILAAMLGIDTFGVIYIAVAHANLAATLAVFGWPAVLMKRIAQNEDEQTRLRVLSVSAFDAIIGLSIVLFIIFLYLNFYGSISAEFIAAIFAISVSRAIAFIGAGFLQGLRRAPSSIIIFNLIPPLILITTISILFFFGHQLTVVQYSIFHVMATVFPLLSHTF